MVTKISYFKSVITEEMWMRRVCDARSIVYQPEMKNPVHLRSKMKIHLWLPTEMIKFHFSRMIA